MKLSDMAIASSQHVVGTLLQPVGEFHLADVSAGHGAITILVVAVLHPHADGHPYAGEPKLSL